MTRLFEAKPFIICEVGSNWHTLEHCFKSIEQAKAAGADKKRDGEEIVMGIETKEIEK